MEPIALAVIGGTGVYKLAALDDVQTHEVETVYGSPSGPVRVGLLNGQRVAFLARHGEGHSIPPHKINYRANLAALKQLGASRVLALNTVGGIGDEFGPRVLACPDQLIDYTWGRISTLSEEEGSEVLHVDFGHPYTPAFRAQVLAAAAAKGVTINNILPGKFDTDRIAATISATASKTGKSEADIREAQQKQIPAGRYGTADEFGAICAFLCSQQAAYITGQNILPDGGSYTGTF